MLFQQNGTTAQQKAYHDMWDFTDRTRQLVLDFRNELEKWELDQAFKEFILLWVNMLEQSSSEEKKLLNYLIYMTQRLVLLKKIISPTGSIYMHCDPTVSHYVKVIMDGIFGFGNFRNEVVWKRMSSHNDAKRWGKIHDTLLFYSMADKFTWTGEARVPYDEAYLKKNYANKDGRGRYTTSPLQARSLSGGGYEYEWRGISDIWKFPKHRLDELDSKSLIHWPKKLVPEFLGARFILTSQRAWQSSRCAITDILRKRQIHRLWPIQKNRMNSLERIILSSTHEGDIVLVGSGFVLTTVVGTAIDSSPHRKNYSRGDGSE